MPIRVASFQLEALFDFFHPAPVPLQLVHIGSHLVQIGQSDAAFLRLLLAEQLLYLFLRDSDAILTIQRFELARVQAPIPIHVKLVEQGGGAFALFELCAGFEVVWLDLARVTLKELLGRLAQQLKGSVGFPALLREKRLGVGAALGWDRWLWGGFGMALCEIGY